MAKYTEWCPALEAALAEPFPAAVVKQKSKGGTRIAFVPWHHYVRRLNALVGSGWSMGEPVVREIAGKLVLGVPVTILGVTRVNFGDEDEGKDDYGTASTNAWAQAFKRTCALFGVGLDMYDKDGSGDAVVQQAQRTPEPTISDRISERIAQLADPAVTLTEKQNRVVKIAQAVADQKNPDPTHLAEAVARLDALADEVLSLNGVSA